MVIDGDVDIVEPELGGLHPTAVVVDRVGTFDAPAAAFGDAAEFLHVDVDQIARSVTFVADLGAP